MDGLTLLCDVGKNPRARDAHRQLMDEVFTPGPRQRSRDATWKGVGIFDPELECVAGLEVGCLQLIVGGHPKKASAFASVAVRQGWRGHGLFNSLMVEALACPDAQGADVALLYAETPALYRRFGFESLSQHAFVGSRPTGLVSCRRGRRLDLQHEGDEALVYDLLDRRTFLSARGALLIDAATFIANVLADEALGIVHSAEHDALIVFEDADDCLVIVDIVAARLPTLATALGILGRTPARVKSLFSPDRIDWQADAVPEDTGLMIRGPVPPAMTAPFMFPPTCEF